MSFFHASIPCFNEESFQEIWDKIRELEIGSCRVEIDTFLGTISIIDDGWALRPSAKYIGIQVVVEDLRDKWDLMRDSDVSDLEFEKNVKIQALELLSQLRAELEKGLNVKSYWVDEVEICN